MSTKLVGVLTIILFMTIIINYPTSSYGQPENDVYIPISIYQFPPITIRVSISTDGLQANDRSRFVSISANGRYISFTSHASNLVVGDTNDAQDIFLHDTFTSQTTQISIASDGIQGNNDSERSSVSADGRYVAFSSYASNLVAGDENEEADVFLHDRQKGQTTLISKSSEDGPANEYSWGPSISDDGRYVAFYSAASNLVPGDNNNSQDIFLYDIVADKMILVSKSSFGTLGDNNSWNPSVSSDGRFIAYHSYASNLVEGDTNLNRDVFVYDRILEQTNRVSISSDGAQAEGDSQDASISADGRFITFFSQTSSLVENDTNNDFDVFVHDQITGETTRVSVSSDGSEGNGASGVPVISDDGRFVAFQSYASNLVQGDTNYDPDIFVHELETGITTRVSVASDGSQVDGNSWDVAISENGRFVTYSSEASNLVSGDSNGEQDVFLHDREYFDANYFP